MEAHNGAVEAHNVAVQADSGAVEGGYESVVFRFFSFDDEPDPDTQHSEKSDPNPESHHGKKPGSGSATLTILLSDLSEAKNVVDEKKHVLSLLVPEVLGDGEAGERYASARTRGLVHLTVDQRHL